MTFDPTQIRQIEVLTKAAQTRNLVPLIGAGISRQASDKFPSWHDLLEKMKKDALNSDRLQREEAEQIDELLNKNALLMAAEDLAARYTPDAYERFLAQELEQPDVQPAPIHESILKLNCPLIITTNYDTLLEDAYAKYFGRSAVTWTQNNAPDVSNYLHTGMTTKAPRIFKIHGSITQPPSIVFTQRDYSRLNYWQPGYRMVVSAILNTKVVLMLGFSGDDPDLRLFLQETREFLEHRGQPDYIFLERGKLNEVEKRGWRNSYGLEVIEYEATPGYPEVTQLIEYLAQFSPK